jgi:hypothetical protein
MRSLPTISVTLESPLIISKGAHQVGFILFQPSSLPTLALDYYFGKPLMSRSAPSSFHDVSTYSEVVEKLLNIEQNFH